MISTNDLRTGATVEIDGDAWSIIDFQHVKPGKGAAFVRTKMKNLRTGSVLERTFNAGEKLSRARVESRKMQFLYRIGEEFTFMDTESYEQLTMQTAELGNAVNYLIDNMIIEMIVFEEKVIGVDLPNAVELKIADTEPGVRGDTATGGSKPATLETGLVIRVPFFINIGETVRVDTRNNEYLGRA